MTQWPRLVTGLVLLAVLARAEDAPDLRRLFPRQADVSVTAPGGLVRLELPPAVVAACRPDLSDLRVLDPEGREVPYLVDPGLPPERVLETKEIVAATLLDVRREERRPQDTPARHRETYVIAAPESGTWELVLTSQRRAFVRRVDVVVQTGGETTSLVENDSVFRLPELGREKLRLPLPAFTGQRLGVMLEGEDGSYLEPTLHLERRRATPARDPAVVPLAEIGRRRAGGRTIVELERPPGIVPGILRVETTTPTFQRRIEVWDEVQGMPAVRLGMAMLFRVEAAVAVEERELALGPARGERLRVEIDDGDSPGLDGLAFAAVMPRPALILSLASPGADAPAATLYFGGGRAHAPRYDLAAFAPLLSGASERERARAAVRLQELARAELGAARPNADFVATPPLAFAMRPGTTIDTRLYSHRRTLVVPPSADGLTRITLLPRDVAHARADLADVRIVDAEARQWPYLLEPDGAREWQSLDVERTSPRLGVSRYRIALPVTPLRIGRLRLDPPVPFLDRPFRLLAVRRGAGELALAGGRLTRRARQEGEITLAFPATAIDGLTLEVVDGDDTPLALESVWVEMLLPELFVAAPAGDYSLLVGHADATAPRYELARVRDVVLALRSARAQAGETAPNPAYSLRARLTSGERTAAVLPQVLLWGALLAAVGVLTVITLRLARREPDSGAP